MWRPVLTRTRAVSTYMWLLLLLLSPGAQAEFRVPAPKAKAGAADEVLARLPAWVAQKFSVIVEENEYLEEGEAEITVKADGTKTIKADSVPSAMYAVNYYLRNYCGSQITWDNKSSFSSGCQDEPVTEISLKAPMIRYFGNQVTFGYSFAFWDWPRWEKFIDWIVLNGFNMILAPTGQEAIWIQIYQDLGLTRSELDEFVSGPPFQPWQRMGNIKKWGGLVSDEFQKDQLELNQKIVARLSDLGIVPILPTFSGFVPDALQRLFPKEKYYRNECWNGFNETYSCTLSLDPRSKLYDRIAHNFIKMQKSTYGSLSHVYSADPFNELQAPTDLRLLREASAGLYRSCKTADPQCIWILQSWSFGYGHWSQNSVKAFLGGVPNGGLIVLDLYAEIEPLWHKFNSFYGHPFVWCILHNFGGTEQLRGNLRHLNKAYQTALNTKNSMIGSGLAMEAISQNYIVYQYMIDRMWSTVPINMEEWIETFATSRYSTPVAIGIWKEIASTLYSEPIDKSKRFSVFIYKRPGFGKRLKYWFPSEKLENIVSFMQLLLPKLKTNTLFRQDLIELERTLLQYIIANKAVLRVYEAYGIGDNILLDAQCKNLDSLLEQLDLISPNNLENFKATARNLARSKSEAEQFATNIRYMVSLWGPTGEVLDYGQREWSGLIDGYYRQRWKYFCEYISTLQPFNRTIFEDLIFREVEREFAVDGMVSFDE